jgi:predicted small secreted protein
MIYSNLKLAALLALALGSMALTACNTVEGAGQDIENAGEAVQDAAE